ncbi:MAG TPA: hypothetical protein PL070_21655, partial [Flavobacteriales bacterium]|nr:hypothetical protein [Flavobacteriales bacterium]
MKKLVQPAELAKASHMRPGDPRIGVLTEVSGLKKLERFYNAIEDLHDLRKRAINHRHQSTFLATLAEGKQKA